MKLSRLPLLLLLVSPACAKDRDDDDGIAPQDSGVTDTGATDTGVNLGFDEREVAGDIATAQCQFLSRCIPEYYDANANDEAACITETADALVEDLVELAPLIQAGRVAYNATAKDGCVAAFQSADCVLGLPVDNPCAEYLIGTQPANAPCFFAVECQQNLYCNRAQGLGTCGACAQAAANGANCDAFTPCSDGTGCAQTGQNIFTCVPITAQQGEACGTAQTGFCQGSLNCIGDQTGMCAPPGGSGAQCDNDPMTFALAECSLETGFACDGAMCTDANWADLNGTCNDTTFCREGYCNAGSCSPLPGAGMSCQAVGACGEDAYCDGTNCRPLIADGQTCNSSAECAGVSVCLGAGVNRPGMCGVLEWELCQ